MSLYVTTEKDVVEGKHIYFQKAVKHNPKTWIYYVYSNDHALLGSVRYYGRWNQYSFYPEEGTVYEKTCLNEIAEFCRQLTVLQRVGIKPKTTDGEE